MCDVAYVLWRERYERVVLALAARYEDPAAYIDQALAAFDAGLEFDPENNPEVTAERRALSLMEEAA